MEGIYLKSGISWLIGLFILALITSCKNKPQETENVNAIDSLLFLESHNLANTVSIAAKTKRLHKSDSIVGDTVWLKSYADIAWSDSIVKPEYTALFSVRVDTNDFIIDTVRSTKGNRIVIGYNHYYNIELIKGGHHWFTISMNKKDDFARILEGTDSWLESNLNVFGRIHYNRKHHQFVLEYNINSRSNFGSLHFIVYDIKEGLKYIGTANSWGGEGPDGEPFLTENGELFVTCFEVYNFNLSASMTLGQYVSLAESKMKKNMSTELIQIHGLRNLNHNNFLTVFNRFHGEPVHNAFILSTDTGILSEFSYFGIIEEMDAILLYTDDTKLNRSFLYDTDREKLICIMKTEKPKVRELSISGMSRYTDDTCKTGKLSLLDFAYYGSYEFYVSETDTTVFYKTDQIE